MKEEEKRKGKRRQPTLLFNFSSHLVTSHFFYLLEGIAADIEDEEELLESGCPPKCLLQKHNKD